MSSQTDDELTGYGASALVVLSLAKSALIRLCIVNVGGWGSMRRRTAC